MLREKKSGRSTFCSSYCLLKYITSLIVEGARWRVVSTVPYKPDDFIHVELLVEYLVPGSDISRLWRILPVSLHLPSKQAPHQGTPTTSFIFLSSEFSDRWSYCCFDVIKILYKMKKFYWLKECSSSWLQIKTHCHKNARAVQNIESIAQLQDSKKQDLAWNSAPHERERFLHQLCFLSIHWNSSGLFD